MALIPSESLNFPDSFRANVGWRLTAEKPEKPRTRAPRQRSVAASRPKSMDPAKSGNEIYAPTPQTAPAVSHPAIVAPPAVADSVEKDDRQLELIPKPPGPVSPEALPNMAEMNALLRHFLTSAAASAVEAPAPVSEPTPPASEPTVSAEDRSIHRPEEPVAEVNAPPNDLEMPPAVKIESPVPSDEPQSTSDNADSAAETSEQPMLVASESPSPAAPAGPVVIETPAQAHHILELIAAAVQRGALVGESVPPASPAPASDPSLSSPDVPPVFIRPVEPIEPAKPVMDSLPAGIPAVTDAAKSPARIRITPRKIRSRVPPPVESEPGVTSPPVSVELPSQVTSSAAVRPTAEKRPEMPVPAELPRVAPMAEAPMRRVEWPESPTRKIAAPRLHVARADLLLFTARERRNRWIAFGFSEAAVVVALVLLGRFGFVHKFPDPTLKLLIFILMLAAAAVAVALPIAFFRNDPERWKRER